MFCNYRRLTRFHYLSGRWWLPWCTVWSQRRGWWSK